MSSCYLHPTNVSIKSKIPANKGIHMFGFSTPKAALTLTEGHICPHCESLGASGSYCGTCQRFIPYTAQSEVLAQTPNKLSFVNSIPRRPRGPVAMSKRYETKVQNGILIMTRRRSSRNDPVSEPDRKKVRPNSAKFNNRDKIIDRFCVNNINSKPSLSQRNTSSKQKEPNNHGTAKKTCVHNFRLNSTRDTASKKVEPVIELSENRVNFPVQTKTIRNRTEPVKTAVVAPYFGENTKIVVSSEGVSRRTGDHVNQIQQFSQQSTPIPRSTALSEPSQLLQLHSSPNPVHQSQMRSQTSSQQAVLSQSQSQSHVQPQSHAQVQPNVQNSQITNQPRQQVQFQLLVSNHQQQQLQHSHSQPQPIQAPQVSRGSDHSLNSAVQQSPRAQVQRSVIAGNMQQHIHQIQLRRQMRQTNRRQAVQITRPGASTAVVTGQAIVNLPGRVVYLQQSSECSTPVTNMPTILGKTPIAQVTVPAALRSAAVAASGVSGPTSPSSVVPAQLPNSIPGSPSPENDELVIIGLSGVAKSPASTNTSTPIESPISTRSTTQQGQSTKYIEKFVYAPNGNDGITLTNDDVLLLNEENYLNDVLIDFYLKYVYHAQLTTQQQNVTYIFNSFFYTRLTQKMPTDGRDFTQGHASVAKWTRRVNLFTKDFVLIPINENSHWFLAIICFPWLVGTINYAGLLGGNRDNRGTGSASLDLSVLNDVQREHYHELRSAGIEPMPCILMFDSLIGQSRSPNVKILRDYLQCEWNLKCASELGTRFFNKDTIRGFSPKVPQQPNGYDCGVFVLHYAELFYSRPVKSFTKGYFQTEMDAWFESGEVRQKRLEMRTLIIDLWRGCQTESHSQTSTSQ